MTGDPHHAAARTPTDRERSGALKAAAERHARTLAAGGMDPTEALVVGYGRAVGDEHARRCADHTPGTCATAPTGGVDDRAALEAHRADLLDRMAARVAARLEQIRDDEGTLL